MRWLDSITDSVDMNLSKLREIVKDREAWHATVHRIAKRHDLGTEQQPCRGKSTEMKSTCLGLGWLEG